MMDSSDENMLSVIIRMYKQDKISETFVINRILDIFRSSKKFNSTNFFVGLVLGFSSCVMMYLMYKLMG